MAGKNSTVIFDPFRIRLAPDDMAANAPEMATGTIGMFSSVLKIAYVENLLVAEAEMAFAIVDHNQI